MSLKCIFMRIKFINDFVAVDLLVWEKVSNNFICKADIS